MVISYGISKLLHTSKSSVSYGCLTQASRETVDIVGAPSRWQVCCGHPIALWKLCVVKALATTWRKRELTPVAIL